MSILKDRRPMVILFVKDQELSTQFYMKLLQLQPTLFVPGMSEFKLNENFYLGLMPMDGIVNILEDKIVNPNPEKSITRCELYLPVDDPQAYYNRLVASGGKGISPIAMRNWGDFVAYGSDPDGHLLAFVK